MEEWSDWVIDGDPVNMMQQIRSILADRKETQKNKLEALTLLANMADNESIDLLNWYYEHADPGMELTAMLALIEARRLNQPPDLEPWHDLLLDRIHEIGEGLTTIGNLPDRDSFYNALVEALREDRQQVEEGCRALLKYDGQLIDLSPLELVVNNKLLIAFWDQEDQEMMVKVWAHNGELDEELLDPMSRFYATLRAANLPWGIQIDISGENILTNIVENLEVDRGKPRVEYILAMPRHNNLN
ncbi:MAG: hypothetical protein ACPGWR_11150 [Ardenticatenaceae bacterium]